MVDRTADVDEAAKALVSARLSFGGRSPYAPDLVLVNKVIENRFVNAVVLGATRYLADQNGYVNGTRHFG